MSNSARGSRNNNVGRPGHNKYAEGCLPSPFVYSRQDLCRGFYLADSDTDFKGQWGFPGDRPCVGTVEDGNRNPQPASHKGYRLS